MTTHDITTEETWVQLADLNGDEREARMLERYQGMVALPEEERISLMASNAEIVYGLSDEVLKNLTVSRLQAWLLMEQEAAQLIATSYDTAMKKLSSSKAMRRVALVQTLAKEFPHEDQERLVTLMPTVFGGMPTAAAKAAQAAQAQSMPQPEPVKKARKGWWPFSRN